MNNYDVLSFYDLPEYELIKNKDENQRDIRLYNFEDVSLTGNSCHYPDTLLKVNSLKCLILPTKEMTLSLQKMSYYEENGMTFSNNSSNNIETNLVEDEIYFFIYNTENYYHFIYDTLPYLYCFLKLKKEKPNMKLLMNYNKNKLKLLPFVSESLQLLNISENDIIIHNENNMYKKIYLSSSLTHNGLSNEPPRKEIFEIYGEMTRNALQIFNTSPPSVDISHDNIYISRRTWVNEKISDNIGTNYTMRRKLINEDDLVYRLLQRDFKEIFGENYSMLEKIVLFSKAKTIIGAIGGTICNCVFCDSAAVIALVSPDFLNINYRMKYLFNDNVILFDDTSLDCIEGEIPKNVRISVIDSESEYFNKLGEIIEKKDDKYLIKLADNYIGWNENEQYDTALLFENQFKKLDNGINSPWKVNIDKLIEIV